MERNRLHLKNENLLQIYQSILLLAFLNILKNFETQVIIYQLRTSSAACRKYMSLKTWILIFKNDLIVFAFFGIEGHYKINGFSQTGQFSVTK